MDQQGPQIGIPPLADPQKPYPAARPRLSWHQADKGGKLPSRLAGFGLPQDGNRRRGRQRANPGNPGNPPPGFVLLEPALDALLEGGNLFVPPADSGPLLA
jgi:hypothetical protein